MVKIEAIIQPCKLDEVKTALDVLGVEGVIACHVSDRGGVVGGKAYYRGAEYRIETPKIKLEMLVSSLLSDEVIETLVRTARTSVPDDDSRILVCPVVDAICIRNGERLEFAAS